ncbi:hypothetical protein Q0601_00570 [Paracoccus onubensis]|nr:hypothetical protein [Paracoccus onubensis]MDP0925655.1 hypothetical protein [Paracoccus onubensis]
MSAPYKPKPEQKDIQPSDQSEQVKTPKQDGEKNKEPASTDQNAS